MSGVPRIPPFAALRAFEAAARHLSFKRAAEELNLTPSAVSHQIKALEDDLGVRLFFRSGRGLQMAKPGAELYPAVRDAFDGLTAAAAAVRRRETRGTLTVSLLASFAGRWLIPRLYDFQQRFPGLDLRLSSSAHLVDFRTEDVDAAIRYGRGDWPGLRIVELIAEVHYPVCSPGTARLVRAPQDLARVTLLHNRQYPDAWRMWLTAAGVAGVDPGTGSTFDDGEMVSAAAASGLGVGLGTRPGVDMDLSSGRLVAPFDLSLASGCSYYLVWPPEKDEDPNLSLFRDWLVHEVELDRRQGERLRPQPAQGE